MKLDVFAVGKFNAEHGAIIGPTKAHWYGLAKLLFTLHWLEGGQHPGMLQLPIILACCRNGCQPEHGQNCPVEVKLGHQAGPFS